EIGVAADRDGRGDHDGVVDGPATAAGELEIRGREVEDSFEGEARATGDDVGGRAPLRRDRPVLEEEHALHRPVRGGGEEAEGAAGETHGPVGVLPAPGEVEGHPAALDRAVSAHREPAAVEDVDAGLERHHGAAADVDAVAVDAGAETRVDV